jgi:hypothetical protein
LKTIKKTGPKEAGRKKVQRR